MKVILLRDVAKIGRRHEIAEVPDGFALNKLIPQGDAKAATAANIKSVTHLQKKSQQDKEVLIANLKEIAESLTKEPLTITAVANAQGHLFKAISENDVATAAKVRGVNIPKDSLVFETPIKAIGEAVVIIKSQGKSFPLTINVVAK
ncbi:MAG TPA: 50S ribosomal protein L9 [Candidatus Paceibacterota bacterium]|nr:50S ribosomal protein L9 [Candidatus Paceibacterota bacterium]HMO83175.1 50S ribosomal protein L9 [Candidatus Paceibacterota bacterium]